MKRFILSAATGALATAFAVPALAGSLAEPTPEPVIQPAPVMAAPAGTDWTGPYVGAQVGWGMVDAEDDASGAELEGDGAIGGLTAGYRYDFGRFVLGGEAQYDWANIDLDELNGQDVDDLGSLDSVGRLKAVAGYDAGRTLIYGSAGWARASAEIDGEDFDDNGWVVGAGVDYLWTDRITVGGEIQYHEFDDFDDTGVDVDATTVQAKMSFRF